MNERRIVALPRWGRASIPAWLHLSARYGLPPRLYRLLRPEIERLLQPEQQPERIIKF